MGYHQAGFPDITGVDNEPQPNYPFRFIQADALEFLQEYGGEYDFIHASPPCQGYSNLAYLHKDKKYPKLVEPIRKELKQLGLPYVIENVPGAPLIQPVILDGRMFGLGVIRKRLFEISPMTCILTPDFQKNGSVKDKNYITVAGNFSHEKGFPEHTHIKERVKIVQDAMEIDWMNQAELTQAIPPAYCKFIGEYMIMGLIKKNAIRLITSDIFIHNATGIKRNEIMART